MNRRITSVLTKLSKVKLEKHDLTKKRTCTLGMNCPWGETSNIYIRVTFTFPRDYPQGLHPSGTPAIELERNPLIAARHRPYFFKRLRRIAQQKRPCLEACLRYLLYGTDGQNYDAVGDSEDSSDDETSEKKSRNVTVTMMRSTKNLAEPITSQGAFGPNGALLPSPVSQESNFRNR